MLHFRLMALMKMFHKRYHQFSIHFQTVGAGLSKWRHQTERLHPRLLGFHAVRKLYVLQACFLLLPTIVAMSFICYYAPAVEHQMDWNSVMNLEFENTMDTEFPLAPPDITEEEMEKLEEELEKRRLRLQRLCANRSHINIFLPKTTIRKLFIDKKHGLTWCPTYKAASSEWMKIFASLGGVLTSQAQEKIKDGKLQINNLARKAFPVTKSLPLKEGVKSGLQTGHKPVLMKSISSICCNAVLKGTRRLIIVRHPFERLLSAYRDKLEFRDGREFYYKRYGRIILKSYNRTNNQTVPTFQQFLQFIVDRHKFDEHWRPYVKECSPCYFKYNFILKTEYLKTEQSYLAYKMRLKELIPKDIYYNRNPKGQTTYEIAKQYFSTIDQKLLQRVYEVYAEDFEMFDYSPNEYLVMAVEKNGTSNTHKV